MRGSLSTEWTGRGSAVKRTRLLGRESRRTTPGAALLRAHEVLGQARQPWWKSHLWLPWSGGDEQTVALTEVAPSGLGRRCVSVPSSWGSWQTVRLPQVEGLWQPCVSNASIGPTLPAGSGEGQLVSSKALDGETQLFQMSCRPPHGRQSRGNVACTRAGKQKRV